MKKKKQEGEFPGMLLGTLGVSMLRNMLTGKESWEPKKYDASADESVVRINI